MGEVYEARDTTLNRRVAIKVLPSGFGNNPDRAARFRREAQLLAALNHPNIAQIHGFEASDGALRLVMELVEGPTLAERLDRRSISSSEALDYARQIAGALLAAHEQGIVHRDLKPTNIKVRDDGVVKVLDFGLAKSLTVQEMSADDTVSSSPSPFEETQPGALLGTVPYMAPEQALGKQVDKRADIWAFGCVLYEMLTGRRAFAGETMSELIAHIRQRDPDWDALPSNTPAPVRRALRRCLERDPERRLRDIADVRFDLDEAAEMPAPAQVRAAARRDRPPWTLPPAFGALRSWRIALLMGSLVLLTAFAAGLYVGRRPAPAPPASPPVAHTFVTIRPADHLSSIPSDRNPSMRRPSRRAIALSPDGRMLVFSAAASGTQHLYRRALDQPGVETIAGTEGGANPFFSPDGRSIGFWAEGRLKRISADGGAAVVLCQAEPPFGASWGSDDVIVYGGGEGLWQVSANGGQPTLLTRVGPDEFSHLQPHVVPGAKAVLFTVQSRAFRWDDARIDVFVRDTGQRKTIVQGAADARYAPTGHLVYVRDSAVIAAPFDLNQFQLTGGPVALFDGVMHAIRAGSTVTDTGAAQIDISESGALAFVAGSAYPAGERIPVWVGGDGNIQPIDVLARDYSGPRLSPDGTRLAITHSVNQSGADIWIYDLKRGAPIRLTSGGGHAWPVWTPDGLRVSFYRESEGPSNLFWQAADGSGLAERLTTSPYHQRPAAWSPDGKELVFSQSEPKTRGDIWVASVSGHAVSSRPLVQEPFDEIFPALSPDGRWLAYASDASGRFEVYVQPYPGPGPKQVISRFGGREPAWARDGRRLYYREPPRQQGGAGHVMAVDVSPGPRFDAGTPSALFEDRFDRAGPIRSYDVGPDGRLLMLLSKESPATPVTEIHLVLNWLDELKRKVPSGESLGPR